MLNRRQLIGSIPVSEVAITSIGVTHLSESSLSGKALITSPPVVQNPRAKSFGVSIAI